MSAPADSRLSDQPPFVWFVRLHQRMGLPALAWLFIAAGLAVAGLRLVALVGTPTASLLLAGALYTVAAVATALLPAALLHRVPTAPRRHPLLFSGLSLLALAAVLRAAAQLLRLGSAETLLISDFVFVGELAGLLLVGVGLLALRASGSAWQPLLILLAGTYLIGSIAPALLSGALVVDLLAFLGRSVLSTIALAFAHAIPLVAWLDRDEPRPFWGLLALVVPLHIAGLVMSAVAMLIVSPEQAGVFELTNPIFSGLAALVGIAALVAYARYAPRPSAG